MGTWPLKREARVLGIDDGPYIRGSDSTPIVMTVYRGDGRIEGFLTCEVATDGDDSSERIAERLMESRFADQIRVIMSDGACLAGFNVLDMDDLFERTGVPVLTCSDEAPDTKAVERALKANFNDWKERLGSILAHGPMEVSLPDGVCYVRVKGIPDDDALAIVKRMTQTGRTPEPIRISHMVAGALSSLNRDRGLDPWKKEPSC